MWFQKEKIIEAEYVIVAEFERDTINPILQERIAQLSNLLVDGYKIVSAERGLDNSIHYVLTRRKKSS